MLEPLPRDGVMLEGPSLRLTPYVESDASWVAALAGRMEVARYTGLPHPMDAKRAAEWIGRHRSGLRQGVSMGWAARLQDEAATPVGGGSVRLRNDTGIVAIGFWLGEAFWGRGLGRELGKCLTNYSFDAVGARRLEADCVAENAASAKILESCGFVQEGRQRGGFFRFGCERDLLLFGALRRERG